MIAIVSILAAILFPVFAQAREKARQTACLSNLKQIGNGLMLYTQDYDETLPGNYFDVEGYNQDLGWMSLASRRNWARDVQPYVKNLQVFVCPSAQPRSARGGDEKAWEVASPPGGNTSYLLNGIASTKPLAAIPAPADIIYLQEANEYFRSAQERPAVIEDDQDRILLPPRAWRFNHAVFSNAHSEGGNLLFCDGHAKWQKKNAIRYAQFGAPKDLNPNLPEVFAPSPAAATASHETHYVPEF